MTLSTQDQAILDLEQGWWQQPGAKAEVIRARIGISPTRYYARLRELLDEPDALEYDPLTVKRLRRIRDERRRVRVSGRTADPRSR